MLIVFCADNRGVGRSCILDVHENSARKSMIDRDR